MGLTPGGSPFPWAREGPAGRTRGRGGQLPAAPGPISVESISCPQSALPMPLRDCQATGQGDRGGVSWLCPGWGAVHRALRVMLALPCRTPTVLPCPLLCAQRAHFHFLRGAQRPPRGHQAHSCCAEEAVGSAQGWRAEPAGPGQRQCAPNGQGLRGALWWREEARHHSGPQDSGPLRAPVIHGAGEWEVKLCASTHSKGTCPVGSSLPAWRGRWPWVTPLPA